MKMDEDTLKLNLKTLKELILDEQKLVTYISLSKELCIHVNESKTLLSQVVQNIRKKNPNTNLNINYIISGLSANNGARTIVCSETDIDVKKSAFKTVFFQHIYSVSQGAPTVDNVAFVTINRFEDFPLCMGLIKGTSCIKRTSDEIGNLKSNSQVTVNEPINPTKKEVKEKTNNGLEAVKDVVNVHETKSAVTIKSEIPIQKKNLSNNSYVKTITTKNVKKTSKGITGFFTKANSVPSTKATKITKDDVQEAVKIENKAEVKVEIMDVDEDMSVKNVKKEPESNSKKNISINQIRKKAKVDKRHKRVLHISDSDSDHEKNDPFADEGQPPHHGHESDDEIPPTPSINTVKVTSGILNPKKKRKVVDKTYTDEDGYILTRKEEIYESCSENEHEVEPVNQVNTEKENVEVVNQIKAEVSPKEKKARNSKKKVSPPQKGKQATLMSFFKKV